MTNKINIQITNQGKRDLQYLKLTRTTYLEFTTNRNDIIALLVKWKGKKPLISKENEKSKSPEGKANGNVGWCSHSEVPCRC